MSGEKTKRKDGLDLRHADYLEHITGAILRIEQMIQTDLPPMSGQVNQLLA